MSWPIPGGANGAGVTVLGVGNQTPIPPGSTNGSPIGTRPSFARGVMLYLNTGDSVTFTVQDKQPTGAPAANITKTVAFSDGTSNWFEYLSGSVTLYITAMSGNPSFRFL